MTERTPPPRVGGVHPQNGLLIPSWHIHCASSVTQRWSRARSRCAGPYSPLEASILAGQMRLWVSASARLFVCGGVVLGVARAGRERSGPCSSSFTALLSHFLCLARSLCYGPPVCLWNEPGPALFFCRLPASRRRLGTLLAARRLGTCRTEGQGGSGASSIFEQHG